MHKNIEDILGFITLVLQKNGIKKENGSINTKLYSKSHIIQYSYYIKEIAAKVTRKKRPPFPIVPLLETTGRLVLKMCGTIGKINYGTIGNCFDSD